MGSITLCGSEVQGTGWVFIQRYFPLLLRLFPDILHTYNPIRNYQKSLNYSTPRFSYFQSKLASIMADSVNLSDSRQASLYAADIITFLAAVVAVGLRI